MATSSILENIRVNNPKAVEQFVNAMEKEAQNPVAYTRREKEFVDSERIKAAVTKGLKKRGIL